MKRQARPSDFNRIDLIERTEIELKTSRNPDTAVKKAMAYLAAHPSRKHRFLPMFQLIVDAKIHALQKGEPGFKGESTKKKYESYIAEQVQDFKRTDRILYILRLKRIMDGREIFRSYYTMDSRMKTDEDSKIMEKLRKQHNFDEEYLKIKESDRGLATLANVIAQLHHFISTALINGYVSILNVEFKDQNPVWLLTHLGQLEGIEVANQRLKGRSEVRKGGTVIDFKNGYKWVILDQGYCELEGKAMAHCGNAGNYDANTRILSLREIKKEKSKEKEIPHLTFILHGLGHYGLDVNTLAQPMRVFGFLGEMKGYGNSQPSSKYHPMIKELLLHPMILWPQGGGYQDANNFNLSQLGEMERERLLNEKPGLKSRLAGYINNPDIMIQIARSMVGDPKIKIQGDEIILSKTTGIDEFEPAILEYVSGEDFRQFQNIFKDMNEPHGLTEGMVINDRDVDVDAFLSYLHGKAPKRYKVVEARIRKEYPHLKSHCEIDNVIKTEKPEWIFGAMKSAMYDGWTQGTELSHWESFLKLINGFSFENGVYVRVEDKKKRLETGEPYTIQSYIIGISLKDFAVTANTALEDGAEFPFEKDDFAGKPDRFELRNEYDYDESRAMDAFMELLDEEEKPVKKNPRSSKGGFDPFGLDF